jgi:hypothetical protein
MKHCLQIGLVLLAGTSMLSGQALRPAGGAPKKGGPPKTENLKKGAPRMLNPGNGPVERLLAMSPEQRERVLEKLPPSKQTELRKRFEQFDKRPPEERERLLRQWKYLESLSPEKRDLLGRQMQAFNALPDERRVVLRRALNQLSRLTPEEREARLASEPFKSRFSTTELQMLSDLSDNFPVPGKE